MFTSPYPAVDAAIESKSVTLGHQLFFDWNEDGAFNHTYSDMSRLVVEAETNRSLEGALPADATLVEGTSAGELRLILSGRRVDSEATAAEIFSPYNPKSPVYSRKILGIPVQYIIVVGSDEGSAGFKQFTGRIRSVKVDAESGDVSITCLDASEDLQAPVTLPIHALFEDRDLETHLFNQHWVMDNILRQNGYYQTPPEHPDANFYASMKGGPGTTKGWIWESSISLSNTAPYPRPPLPSAFGMWGYDSRIGMYPDTDASAWKMTTTGLTNMNIPRTDVGRVVGGAYQFYGIPNNSPFQSSDTYISGYLNGAINITVNDGSGGLYEKTNTAWWTLSTHVNGIDFRLVNSRNGGTYDKTVNLSAAVLAPYLYADRWNSIQAEWVFKADRVTANLCINGQWTTTDLMGAYPAVSPGPLYPPFPYIEWPLLVRCQNNNKAVDFHSYSGTTQMYTIFSTTFKKSAQLDYCLNYLSHTPPVVQENSWNVLRELAAAEYGSLFVDEDGIVQYRNRQSTRQLRNTVNKRLGEDRLSGLAIEHASESIRNVITAQSQGMYRSGLWGIWDANKDPFNEELTNGYTFAPGGASTNNFTITELDHFVYPSHMGRNCIPWFSPMTVLWQDFETAQESTTAKSPTMGLFGVQADNGALQQAGKATVDLWPTTDQRSMNVGVFVFSSANPVGAHAVQLSNYPIDSYGANAPGSAVDPSLYGTGGTRYPNVVGDGVTNRKYTLRIPGVSRRWGVVKNISVNDAFSVGRYSQNVYNIDLTRWTQSYSSMVRVCEDLLKEMGQPVPVLGDVTVPGDPRIQLGDTIVVSNRNVLGDLIYTTVAGITRSLTSDGLVDTYTLKIMNRPASWILGHPDYSVLRNEANKDKGTTIVQSALY